MAKWFGIGVYFIYVSSFLLHCIRIVSRTYWYRFMGKEGKAKGKQLESGDYLIFDKLVIMCGSKIDITTGLHNKKKLYQP